jgi:hypothetical protein
MPPCSSDWHPQVPTTNASVLVSYCWSCQAFVVTASRSTQHDDDTLSETLYTRLPLGPFDGVPEARRRAHEMVDALFGGSGLPWDHSSSWWATPEPSDPSAPGPVEVDQEPNQGDQHP